METQFSDRLPGKNPGICLGIEGSGFPNINDVEVSPTFSVAAAQEGDALFDNIGLRALIAATKETHEQLASDDVAALTSSDGLQETIKSLLTIVASDPAFLTSDAALQASITTVLTKAATVLPDALPYGSG